MNTSQGTLSTEKQVRVRFCVCVHPTHAQKALKLQPHSLTRTHMCVSVRATVRDKVQQVPPFFTLHAVCFRVRVATRHLPKNSFWPHIHHGRQLTQTHTHTPPPPLRWVRVCVVGRVGRAITAQKTPHHLLQKGSPNAVRMPSLCEHKKQRQTIRTSTASTTNQPNSH